jgi:hypothetical protein
MTNRWLRIVVAVLGFLLTLSTFARAECAWVLWGLPLGAYETTGGVGDDGRPKGTFVPTTRKLTMPDPWIEQAYGTQRECQTAVAHFHSEPIPPGGEQRLYKSFSLTDGTSLWVSSKFLCLPDTIDPRGPKGK